MSFKNLTNSDLHQKLISLAHEERKLTLELLEHLREVERRRLFAERGHASLFEYVVQELRYSESAAQRRIFAMRALQELPELGERIESGELKVTQLAQVQSFLRAERKSGKTYSLSDRKDLITATIGKSTRETEKILAEKNPEYAKREKVRVLSATQTELTFTADEALMRDLQSVRDRFAHRLAAGASLAEVVGFMAKTTLATAPERKKGRSADRSPTVTPPRPKPAISLPAPVVASQQGPILSSRYVPVEVKRIVWRRDQGQCAYISPITRKRCESRHRLQIDHIVPFSRGGSSCDLDGLRLLCFAHNQFEASRILGTNPEDFEPT